MFIDNSGEPYEIIAEGNSMDKIEIQNESNWYNLIEKYKRG